MEIRCQNTGDNNENDLQSSRLARKEQSQWDREYRYTLWGTTIPLLAVVGFDMGTYNEGDENRFHIRQTSVTGITVIGSSWRCLHFCFRSRVVRISIESFQ